MTRRMDNATYWALKRREMAARREEEEAKSATRAARRARTEDRVAVIPTAEPRDLTVTAETSAEAEAKPYRELQAEAKELDIPANQSRDDLEAAIAEAKAGDAE